MSTEIKRIQQQQKGRESELQTDLETQTDSETQTEDELESESEITETEEAVEFRPRIYVNGYYVDKEHVISYIDEDMVWHMEFKNNEREPWEFSLPKDIVLEHTSLIYSNGTLWKHGTPYGSKLRIGCIELDLKQEDGMIYFDWDYRKIDITEDFADGMATGICEIESPSTSQSERYRYRIEGTLEDYTAMIWILPEVSSKRFDTYLKAPK